MTKLIKLDDVCWNPDYKQIQVMILTHSRWYMRKRFIVEHIPTGKYYSYTADYASTELQETDWYQYIDLVEVEEKEVLVKQWVVKA